MHQKGGTSFQLANEVNEEMCNEMVSNGWGQECSGSMTKRKNYSEKSSKIKQNVRNITNSKHLNGC